MSRFTGTPFRSALEKRVLVVDPTTSVSTVGSSTWAVPAAGDVVFFTSDHPTLSNCQVYVSVDDTLITTFSAPHAVTETVKVTLYGAASSIQIPEGTRVSAAVALRTSDNIRIAVFDGLPATEPAPSGATRTVDGGVVTYSDLPSNTFTHSCILRYVI